MTSAPEPSQQALGSEPAARPWRRELAAQVRLATPVVVIQFGLMAMGLVDGAVVGRYSVADQAAVQVAHGYGFLYLGFGMGILSAMDPLVSQAWGARDTVALRRAVQRALVLAVILTVPAALGIAWTEAVVGQPWLEQPESVVPIAGDYALVSLAGLLPFLVFSVFRQALQAMHRLRPLVIAILATNVLNAFLDWVFVFGHLGLPPAGAVGSSWATVISRWTLTLSVLWLSWPLLRPYLSGFDRAALRFRPLLRTVALGVPIGCSWTFEIGAFYCVLLLAGQFGEDWQAAHTVTMNLASGSFMVPLGISIAASVRVGNAIGAGDQAGMRRAARVALVLGVGVMVLFAALFVALPLPFARIFSDIPEVLTLAVLLIPIAGAFQVFDGIQVVAVGVLRGAADTRVPMLIQVGGFWLLGMPVGYWLGIRRGAGPEGLWWGLVAGLVVVAALQLWRVFAHLARDVARADVEDGPERPDAPST